MAKDAPLGLASSSLQLVKDARLASLPLAKNALLAPLQSMAKDAPFLSAQMAKDAPLAFLPAMAKDALLGLRATASLMAKDAPIPAPGQ